MGVNDLPKVRQMPVNGLGAGVDERLVAQRGSAIRFAPVGFPSRVLLDVEPQEVESHIAIHGVEGVRDSSLFQAKA